MKKGRFLWSAHRITEKQKAGKARNIKGKQLKNSRRLVITLQNARKEQPTCTVETDADGYVTAVEMHVEMDVEAVGYVPGTDVKTMMLYAYGLPHEKLSLLSLNSDITSDRDSYTRNLGSLTVTQKIEMKGLKWLDPDNSEGNFLVQTNENAKDAHFALTFRIEET